MTKVLFRSHNLIGDGLYTSIALNQYHKEHPEVEVHLGTINNFITPIYERMGVPLVVWTTDLGNESGGYDWLFNFDVNKAYQLALTKQLHLAEAYAEMLGVTLDKKPDRSHLKPIFIPTPEILNEDEKGVILVSCFSASCASREGLSPTKMLPWPKWAAILRLLRSFGRPLRFIGGPKERIPLDISEDEYLLGISLNRTALIMQHSPLLVSIDNGMGHLAASQGTPTFLFYPACLPTSYILPLGNPKLLFTHCNPATVDTGQLVSKMRQALAGL